MSIALISDIHGNSPALRAVLDDIRQQGCEQLFVLGDVINGIDPQGCLDLLKTHQTVEAIRGNAESYTLTPDLEHLPNEDEIGVLWLIRWFLAHIDAAALAQMQTWPDFLRRDGFCLVHDSPFDRIFPQEWHKPHLPEQYQEWFHHPQGLTQFMEDSLRTRLQAWMEAEKLSFLFCGHTHEPFVLTLGERLICNVGSVGLPLDGDPRACWVKWQPELPGEAGLTIRRVDYDTRLTLQMLANDPTFHDGDPPAMRQAYNKMIASGIHWKVHIREITTT